MPKEFPYMPLWVAELISDGEVRMMDCAEFGAYMALLCAEWLDGSLPVDDKRLATLAKATPEQWDSVKKAVLTCFEKRGEFLSNRRVRTEKANLAQKREKKRAAGAIGGKSSTRQGVKNKQRLDSAQAKSKHNPSKQYRTEQNRTNKEKPPLSAEALSLCGSLRERIQFNDPQARVPVLANLNVKSGWGKDARLLLETDKRPVGEALKLIEFATGHHFWRSNILSMGKFRQQYTQLKLQMEKGNDQNRGGSGRTAAPAGANPGPPGKFAGRD